MLEYYLKKIQLHVWDWISFKTSAEYILFIKKYIYISRDKQQTKLLILNRTLTNKIMDHI